MTQLSFDSLTVDADPVATRAAYTTSAAVDPACCNACATFLLALQTKDLPPGLIRVLEGLGVDASRPTEAWGAPDGGFIQVWWPFFGTIAIDGEGQEQSIVIGDGQTLRITTDYPKPNWQAVPGLDIPAIEFTWVGDAVRDLEQRAWTPVRP